MNEIKSGFSPISGSTPVKEVQKPQGQAVSPIQSKASDVASSPIKNFGSQVKKNTFSGIRSIKNAVKSFGKEISNSTRDLFDKVKTAAGGIGSSKKEIAQPAQQATPKPAVSQKTAQLDTAQGLQDYVNKQRMQQNTPLTRPAAQQSMPAVAHDPEKKIQDAELNTLQQHGKLAANHGEAMAKLKDAKLGDFCVWKSQSRPGEVSFLQKTPAGMYLESLGKKDVLKQVDEMHTGKGQFRTLVIQGQSAMSFDEAKTKLQQEPNGFFVWESKSQPGTIGFIHNTPLGPESLRFNKDANIFNNIQSKLTAKSAQSQQSAPIAQVATPKTPNGAQIQQVRSPLASASKDALWSQLTTLTGQIQHRNLPSAQVSPRYADIGCEGSTAITGGGKGLHANLVGGGLGNRRFIATQAPLVNESTNQTETFWKAMLENSNTIVDLTTEDDKSAARANQTVTEYYPTSVGQTMEFGSCKVTLKSSVKSADTGTAHTYVVQDKNGGPAKEITRVHYPDWVDHGSVDVNQLDKLVNMLSSSYTSDKTCIHCRAGVGRTGTLTAAYYLKEKVASGEIHAGNLEEKLLHTVLVLRSQRDNKFVQTKDQLDMLRGYGKKLLQLP